MARWDARAALSALAALAMVAASPSPQTPPAAAHKAIPSEQVLASEQREPSTSTPIPVPAPAPAEPASPWLGAEVVLKSAAATTPGGARDVAYRRYRVERVDGQWLWLTTPGEGGNWVKADDVVAQADADRYFSEQIRSKGNSVRSHNRRAMVRHDKKDFDGAIADYTEALRLDPSRPSLYNNRAAAWLEKGDADRAIADYTEAIRLDPKVASAYHGRALAWLTKGEYDKAIADDDEAIRLRPRLTGAYMNRGLARLDKKDYDKAIADFNEAIRLEPENPAAYNNRGHAREARQEHDQALADYSEAIRLDPKYVRAYNNRGRLRESRRDFVGALADYDEAIRLDPKGPSGYRHRAWIWATSPDARLRDGATAVKAATRANELTGWKDPASLGVLAAAEAEAGHFDAAVKWQTEALRLLPPVSLDQPVFRARLGLYRAGKPYHQQAPDAP